MSNLTVGLVGWRGMVGSVLIERMREEKDFDGITPVFFSTSNAGGDAPSFDGIKTSQLKDAHDIAALAACDVIITCQGGDYTSKVHQPLRDSGWTGYWIDAASTLRMEDDSIIILDPVNRSVIDSALANGKKDFIGGNCTVSLMLMAIGELFNKGWVEWVSAMTHSTQPLLNNSPIAMSISDTVQLPLIKSFLPFASALSMTLRLTGSRIMMLSSSMRKVLAASIQ